MSKPFPTFQARDDPHPFGLSLSKLPPFALSLSKGCADLAEARAGGSEVEESAGACLGAGQHPVLGAGETARITKLF